MSNTFHHINVCSCPLTVCQVDYLASIRVYILDEIRFVKIPPLYGLFYIYIYLVRSTFLLIFVLKLLTFDFEIHFKYCFF